MAEEKPLHHRVPVVRITEVLNHPNADKLDIIPIGGYQAISAKGQFKPGDLAYYIYPDSIVPVRPEFEFLWKDKIVAEDGTWRDGLKEVPLKYRRITARRLRKEWSEGLLMPLPTSMYETLWDDAIPLGRVPKVKENQDISDLIGVTHHQPPDPDQLGGSNERGPRSHLPRSFKGWMYWVWYKVINALGFDTPPQGTNERGPKTGKPYYDIENFKNHKSVFEEGEPAVVTEKIHGCQGKYVYQDGKMYVGSRNFWKSAKSKCIWRKCLEQNPWIEVWCRVNEGFTLYGEVIPCQGEKFMYGYKQGEVGFRVFDVLTPEHTWIGWDADPLWAVSLWVPILYEGPYDVEKIRALVDGKSALGSGIREGIVIKPVKERHVRGLGRAVLKLVSNQYLERN